LRPPSLREASSEEFLHWVNEDRGARWAKHFGGDGLSEAFVPDRTLLPAVLFRFAKAFEDRHANGTGG
jgi:hypothetical protein